MEYKYRELLVTTGVKKVQLQQVAVK